MDRLETLCEKLEENGLNKLQFAIAFLWFHCRSIEVEESGISEINQYFSQLNLPVYNPTRLRNDLKKTRDITKGTKTGLYKISRSARKKLEESYGDLFLQETSILKATEIVDLSSTPFLTNSDIEASKHMAELYVINHCYENSVRRLIEVTLSKWLGENWWGEASSAPMKRKFSDRKAKEIRNKWISPRGASSQLFYIDWGDLVTLIRKYPTEFSSVIHDIKFVELRLEEMEKIRNIVAHNGVLPSEDDFQRVILSFKDWCKQVSS